MLPVNRNSSDFGRFSHISDPRKIEEFTPEIKLLNHLINDFLNNECLQKKISNNEICTFNIEFSNFESTIGKLDIKQINEVHSDFQSFLKSNYSFTSKLYESNYESNSLIGSYQFWPKSINTISKEKIFEKKYENHEQDNVVKNLNTQNSMLTDNRITYPEDLLNYKTNTNTNTNIIMTEEKKDIIKNTLSSDKSEFINRIKQLEEELIKSDNRNIELLATLNDVYAGISQDDCKIENKNEPITNKNIVSEKTQDSDLERVNAELLKKIEQLTILSENQAAMLKIQEVSSQNDLLEKITKQEKLILQQAEILKDHDKLLIEQIKQEKLIVNQAIKIEKLIVNQDVKITVVKELLIKKDKLLNDIEKLSLEIINLFECPISFETIGTEHLVDVNIPGSIKSNAFIVPSGQTYGPGLIDCLKINPSNPVTKEPLTLDQLYPNLIVQKVVPLLTELNEKIKKGCS